MDLVSEGEAWMVRSGEVVMGSLKSEELSMVAWAMGRRAAVQREEGLPSRGVEVWKTLEAEVRCTASLSLARVGASAELEQ